MKEADKTAAGAGMSGSTMIVQLSGGLGNQLFQFAFGRALALRSGGCVLFDASPLEHPDSRKYVLDRVGLAPRLLRQTPSYRGNRGTVRIRRPLAVRISYSPVKREFVWVKEKRDFLYDPDMLLPRGDSYLQGYWQSYKYFVDYNDKIVGEITLPFRDFDGAGLAWLARIREGVSVAVHVRRGDYLHPHTSLHHGVCAPSYYAAAFSLVRGRAPGAQFFVFSDDPDWCRTVFRDDDVRIVDANGPDDGPLDLALMASCRHHIIANSSFSWWGAWLARREGQIVIAPTPWMRRNPVTPDLVPPDWILLHRETGADWAEQLRALEETPVSVVIPSRNRPAMLAEAVESVASQSKRHVEIIIALNDATEECRRAAGKLSQSRGATVVEIAQASLSAARNAGIAAATAEWIAFLDDDDVWLPGKLKAQLEAAMLTGADLVSCNFRAFDEHGDVTDDELARCPADFTFAEALMLGNFVSGGSAALTRKSILLKLGGFDESLPAAEDVDMWRRIARNHEIAIVDEPLLRIRRHGSAMTGDPKLMLTGITLHFLKLLRDTPPHLEHMLPRACEAFLSQFHEQATDAGLLRRAPAPPPPRRTGLRRLVHDLKSRWRRR